MFIIKIYKYQLRILKITTLNVFNLKKWLIFSFLNVASQTIQAQKLEKD